MGKTVDKVISHGKNFNTGDFAIMVCPECATLYEDITPDEFTENKTFVIKKGRQVQFQCRNCKCRFERKIYDKTIPIWHKLIPLIFLIAWLTCIVLFFVAIFLEIKVLGLSALFFGIISFLGLIATGIDINF